MPLSERSKFAKKVASNLEELTGRKLRNSTSHYEFEIRMIEGKSGDYYLLVKLNTIVDRRFDYRENLFQQVSNQSMLLYLWNLPKIT